MGSKAPQPCPSLVSKPSPSPPPPPKRGEVIRIDRCSFTPKPQLDIILELLDDESIIESLAEKYITGGAADRTMMRIRAGAMADYAKYLREKYQERKAAQNVPA